MVMLIYFEFDDTVPNLVCVGPFPSHELAEEEGKAERDACGQFWTIEVAPPKKVVVN